MIIMSTTIQLPVVRYFIDGRPACAVYKKEMGRKTCRFLQVRRFGTVYICGLNTHELPLEEEGHHLVPDWCPLGDVK